MTCDDALLLASDRLDGALPPADAAALEAHLAGCEACRRASAALGRADDAVRALPPPAPPTDPWPGVAARLRAERRRGCRRRLLVAALLLAAAAVGLWALLRSLVPATPAPPAPAPADLTFLADVETFVTLERVLGLVAADDEARELVEAALLVVEEAAASDEPGRRALARTLREVDLRDRLEARARALAAAPDLRRDLDLVRAMLDRLAATGSAS
ncbi:MAG: zf-HC2 domain-containing protein [Planctomycetes bacterium]|nr:zf-HC2 domain-containing protein [Planctomycetota bacterium]